MKNLIVLVLFLALGAAAQAKLAPVDPHQVAISADDMAIATGPAGSTLERDYFRAPQPAYATGHIFPCRLQLRIFEKARIAQSCN